MYVLQQQKNKPQKQREFGGFMDDHALALLHHVHVSEFNIKNKIPFLDVYGGINLVDHVTKSHKETENILGYNTSELLYKFTHMHLRIIFLLAILYVVSYTSPLLYVV